MLPIGRGHLFVLLLVASLSPVWAQPAKPLSALPPGDFQFQGHAALGARAGFVAHHAVAHRAEILGRLRSRGRRMIRCVS